MSLRDSAIEVFHALQVEAHECARANGFWSNLTDEEVLNEVEAWWESEKDKVKAGEALNALLREAIKRARETHEKPLAVQLALQHSELSEVLEAARHDNPPSEKIPGFSQVEEEYADTIIRILDTAEKRNLRLAEAILAKMAYNRTRPHRHGKKF